MTRDHKWFLFLPGLLLALHILLAPATHAQERGPVYYVQVEDVVTSVKIDYLRRALRTAEASDATALLIEMSSDGAVLRDIRPFAAELAEADVPVVVYVSPPGTQSGAAGAFFLSAAHIAAMAPNTSFGTPLPLASVDDTLSDQTQDLVLDSVIEQLREWNEARGRNTDWIDAAVREGVVRSNEQAMATDPPAIDIVAPDLEELMTLLEGRTVELANGDEVQFQTLGREPTPIPTTLWEEILLFITDPTVTFLLLVLGAIAVYAELATPGVGIAAGVGVVLLLTALIGVLVLPVRPISLLGLALAFTLIGADIYLSSNGGLTVAGLVLLIISAINLIDTAQAPNVLVALWAILVVVLTIAAFSALVIWVIMRTRNTPITTGQESLVGRLAEVRKTLDPEGMVFVDGALWRAVSEDGVIEKNEWVRISSVHELRLVVHRIDVEA